MAKSLVQVMDRIQLFQAVWLELAPEETFAGMTLAEFEAAISPPASIRASILSIEKRLEGKKTERAEADLEAMALLDLVVNSVRGTPGFGANSALYRALGYVRKSERKSGMTRKSKASTVNPTVDTNAA